MSSLGWVFCRDVAGLYLIEDENAYRDAYAGVLQFLAILSDHLCEVAKKNDFGGSLLVREIDQMIRQIGVEIIDFVKEPAPLEKGDNEALISGFTQFLAFYSAAFREKNSIDNRDNRRVEQCCDFLTYMGLRFLSSNRPIVLRHCICCMESIIESVCASIKPPKLLYVGRCIRVLVGHSRSSHRPRAA